jgi:hypothetical protein
VKKIDESVCEQQARSRDVKPFFFRKDVWTQQHHHPYQQQKHAPDLEDIVVKYHPDGGGEENQGDKPKKIQGILYFQAIIH